jgi:hypothetical protein
MTGDARAYMLSCRTSVSPPPLGVTVREMHAASHATRRVEIIEVSS